MSNMLDAIFLDQLPQLPMPVNAGHEMPLDVEQDCLHLLFDEISHGMLVISPQGRVLHSKDYRSPDEFAGLRVIVIGGANSAVQIAHELAGVSRVTLASRRAIRLVPQRMLGRDFHFWIRASGLDLPA